MVLALLLPFKVCVLLILLKSSFSLTLERHQSIRHHSKGIFDGMFLYKNRARLEGGNYNSVVNKLDKPEKTGGGGQQQVASFRGKRF
jgi:hypothetical protein